MSTVLVHTGIHVMTYYIMKTMLLWYVLYSAFMWISVHSGEIDFSIISALKSQVSPRIAGHCKMHSKVYVTVAE